MKTLFSITQSTHLVIFCIMNYSIIEKREIFIMAFGTLIHVIKIWKDVRFYKKIRHHIMKII